MKDAISTEKVDSFGKTAAEKELEILEKTQSLEITRSVGVEEKAVVVVVKGVTAEPPMQSKGGGGGGTPKKNESSRNIFAGLRQSPKKNPWTRNAPSEPGKEVGKEAGSVGGASVLSGTETGGDGIGIEIPKGEVGYMSLCVCGWVGGSSCNLVDWWLLAHVHTERTKHDCFVCSIVHNSQNH